MDETSEKAEPAVARRRRFGVFGALLRVVVIVGGLVLAVRWSAVLESYAFIHPGAREVRTPTGFEDVYFTTSDGLRLHGWWMPARTGSGDGSHPRGRGPAVLHCHGNEAAVDDHASWSEFLTDRGIGVLVFDYRGYGRSQNGGRWITRNDLMRDTQAAYEYLVSRPDVDPGRVGIYGVSLGGAFGLRLAAEQPSIRAVVTIATFSTWPGVAVDFAPIVANLLIQTGLAQVDSVRGLGSRPYLIVHGDHDSIVSYRHAPLLLEAAKAAGVRATLLTVPGADHLDILSHERSTEPSIARFFVQELGGSAQ